MPAFRFTPAELLQSYVQGRWARAGVVGAVRTSARRSPDQSREPSDAVTTYRLPERPPAVARKAA